MSSGAGDLNFNSIATVIVCFRSVNRFCSELKIEILNLNSLILLRKSDSHTPIQLHRGPSVPPGDSITGRFKRREEVTMTPRS